MLTLIEQIEQHSINQPDKVAIICNRNKISYKSLYDSIISQAIQFINQGLLPNDKVVLFVTNHSSFIIHYFAAHRLGAIAVPVDNSLGHDYKTQLLSRLKPKLICTCVDSTEYNDQKNTLNISFPKLDLIADILFTSGSTRQPKGVLLSHQAIAQASKNINQYVANTKDDCEIISIPLSHSFGLGRVRCILQQGGQLILIQRGYELSSFFQALDTQKVSGLSLTPANVGILFKLTKDKIGDYSNQLKYIELGSSLLIKEYKLRLLSLLPDTRLCMHYGLTEASRSVFTTLSKTNNSVGKPTPGVEIKIINHKITAPHQKNIGEIAIKGEHLFSGYWDDPELTKKSFIGLWFKTSDMGYFDSHGFLHLCERKQNIFNVGGRKLSAHEIEYQLLKHPSILDCACIATPCPNNIAGDSIKAVMCIKKGATIPANSTLASFLRARLAYYKVPSSFQWVEAIPRTSTGKIQRHLLQKDNHEAI